jgi:cardiolipin synthase
VGTINFDNRSFQLHDEVTLCVWDRQFADALSKAFSADLERSDEITAERWSDRSLFQRATEASTKVLRREL